VPAVVFPVAYKICKELQADPTGGKRKVHYTVIRREHGGYEAIPNAEYVGYKDEEYAPVDVGHVVVAEDDAKETAGVFQIPRRTT
jgi:hypothetical protein